VTRCHVVTTCQILEWPKPSPFFLRAAFYGDQRQRQVQQLTASAATPITPADLLFFPPQYGSSTSSSGRNKSAGAGRSAKPPPSCPTGGGHGVQPSSGNKTPTEQEQDRGGQRQQSATGSRPPWTVGGIHCTITCNSGGYGLARSWVRSHLPIDLVTIVSALTCGSGRVGRIHRQYTRWYPSLL